MKYIDINQQVLDKGTGYFYIYFPDHEMANASGKVYIHRYIASLKYGRILGSNEHVHHIDENKINNDESNLLVLTPEEHGKLHSQMNGHVGHDIICETCNVIFISHDDERKYCSHKCSTDNKKRFDISPDKLKELIWTYPTSTIASMYGVSDKAIEKRCKKFNIEKPPRGYWTKQKHKAP